VLDELDRAESRARPQSPGRARERLPEAVLRRLEEEHLRLPARLPPHADARGDDAGVVHDDERAVGKLRTEVAEAPVPDLAGGPVDHQQPGFVASLERSLGDQLGREVIVELRGSHAIRRQE
jgi:hypothetical protein